MTAIDFGGALAQAGRSLPELSFKAALVLGVAGALAFALRRRSASARHLVWSTAIAGVLALPLTQMVPLRIPVLPASLSRADAVPAVVPAADASSDLSADLAADESGVVPETAAPLPSSTLAGETAPAVMDGGWSLAGMDRAALLVAVWAVGAAALLLRLLVGTATVWWLARKGERIEDEAWTAAADRISRGFDGPSARLIRSPYTEMPMTWGMVRPVVLLPADCDTWPAERRDVVLRHELAHVARRDVVTLALAQVACAVHWFNPLAWFAAHQLRAEAERCCDDWVLRSGTRASTYAGHLLEMVRIIGRARVPTAVALPMAQRSTFEGRLLAILEPGVERGAAGRGRAAMTAGGLAVLVLALGAMRPAEAAPAAAATELRAERAAETPETAASAAGVETPASPAAPASVAAMPAAAAGAALADEMTAGAAARARMAGGKKGVPGASVSALLGAMGDADAEVRRSVTRTLGMLKDPRSVEALIRALRSDADAGVRNTAAWALGQIEDRAAVPALLQALSGDRAIEVRRTAAWALGQIEDRGAVDGLVRAIGDGDTEVRETAVWALGQIQDPASVEPLTGALRSGDVAVRRLAAWALGQIEAKAAVQPLVAAMRDADREVRETAVWALGQIEAPEAVPALTAALRDDNARVRNQVAWALGQIESEASVAPLGTVLQSDPDADVRQTAAWALGEIESHAAVAALTAALRDASPRVRAQAAWAIGQVEPDRAPEGLVAALRDADRSVRQTAVWALGQIGDPTALESILRDGDPEMRAAAAAAMGGRRHVDPRPQPRPQPRPRPRPRPEF